MNTGVKQIPSKQSIVAFTSNGPTVRIRGILLRELVDGSIWLENEVGEGMQVTSDKLEPLLRKFFNEHF